jgi:hypothetical protein
MTGIGQQFFEAGLLLVATGGGFGLTVWVIKNQLSGTEQRLKDQVDGTEARLKEKAEDIQKHIIDLYEKHRACREDLPKTYATADDLDDLEASHAALEKEVSYMKGKQNGAANSRRAGILQ